MLVCQLYTSSASSASDLLLRTNRPKFCSLLFSLSWPYRKHADCRTCCSHVQRVIDRVDNRDLCDCAYPAHLMSTPPLGGPCCNTAMTLVMDKLEWCAGPAGLYPVKKVWIYAYSFRQNSRTWRTDGRTDRQTPHDGIGRACIASRGKTDLINIGSVEILFTTGMLN